MERIGGGDDTGTLMFISWNVRGVETSIESFLRDLSREVQWDYLLLQEFSGSARTPPSLQWSTFDGHLVFQQAPGSGRKVGAMVVHARNAMFVNKDSFQGSGRSWSLDVRMPGDCFRLVGAHMHPGHFTADGDYWDNIVELDDLIASTPFGYKVIVGADVQDALGPGEIFTSCVLGPYSEGIRGDKGDLFLALALEHRLRALNTFERDPGGTYTCNYDLTRPPKQIDFTLSNLPAKKVKSCRTLDSSAAVTDHRGVVTIVYTGIKRKKKYWVAKGPKKPIGWSLADFTFNDQIRKQLDIEDPFPENSQGLAYRIYTDGSFRRGNRNIVMAGWGFVAFDRCEVPGPSTRVVCEASGPTVDQQGTRILQNFQP